MSIASNYILGDNIAVSTYQYTDEDSRYRSLDVSLHSVEGITTNHSVLESVVYLDGVGCFAARLHVGPDRITMFTTDPGGLADTLDRLADELRRAYWRVEAPLLESTEVTA